MNRSGDLRRRVRSRLGYATMASLTLFGGIAVHGKAFGASLTAGTPVTVSVDAGHALATVPDAAVGVNTAVWDGHLQDSSIPGLLQGAGTQILRFPGGSTSDAYHWQTNSITPGQGGYANPANTFDNFMTHVAQPAQTSTMVTVNYGSNAAGNGGGDPSEAAAWVNYANNTQHYGVKYWEIGNEIYGNGYYGSAWETDLHTDHSPTAYANNAVAFSTAMKAQDPTIKVGLVLTAPGNWPDGQGPQQWNPTVLSIACQAADFVSVHWYAQQPGQESDAGLLASTSSISGMVSQLRSALTQYCGARASQIGIMITETNSVAYNPGKQTTAVVNGLFLIENYLEWLQAGVQNVTWWDLHNGPSTGNNNSTSLSGTTTYGDYGVLSSGTSPEPAANTAFPSYTALTLLKGVLVPNATIVSTSSANSDVKAYGVKGTSGSLSVVLVNTSPTTTYAVTPALTNFGVLTSGSVTSFSLASPLASTSVLPVQGGTTSYALAPYSAAVLTLASGAGTTSTPTPSSTGTATPTPSITGTATLTPTATSVPTATSTPTPTTSLVMGNFEGSNDGWSWNADITNAGPSTWSPTVALGTQSLWTQYNIPSAWSEVQLYKAVNTNLSAYKTLSASIFPKSPTVSGPGVQARFLVQGSNHKWYASPYRSVTIGVRTTMTWDMSAVPRAPMKAVYVCWQYTTAATGSGNELWVDDIQAS